MSAWPALAQQVFDKAGISGSALSWGDEICSTWPARAAEPSAGPWDAATAAPILVVGNTQDPSTPLQNSQAMAKLLADARLVTMKGYGHTAFLNPSTCVNDLEVSYFVDGTLPADGTTCEQDKAPFAG